MDELQLAGEFEELELQPKGSREKWESDGEEEEGDEAVVSDEEGGAAGRCGSEPGELTCAICLSTIGGDEVPLADLAMVKGCDHMYCVKCILTWALHKEQPWCPQCKAPFNYLLTYRALDGTLQDFPCEESVVLLKRARWFEDHMRATEKGKALLEESRLADDTAWQDWADDYELASDEEMEAYYFSSAAGRARVVIGNRRFGEGGYVSGGRRIARAANPVPRGRHNSGKGGKTGEHAVLAAPNAPAVRTPNARGGRRSDGLQGAAASGAAAGGAAASCSPAPPHTIPTPHASRSISVPASGTPSRGGNKGRVARWNQPTSGPGSDSAADGSAAAAAAAAAAMASGSGWGGGSYGSSPSGARSLYGSSPGSSAGGLYGSSPAGSGRRARRNAKRAAQDYAAEGYAY